MKVRVSLPLAITVVGPFIDTQTDAPSRTSEDHHEAASSRAQSHSPFSFSGRERTATTTLLAMLLGVVCAGKELSLIHI